MIKVIGTRGFINSVLSYITLFLSNLTMLLVLRSSNTQDLLNPLLFQSMYTFKLFLKVLFVFSVIAPVILLLYILTLLDIGSKQSECVFNLYRESCRIGLSLSVLSTINLSLFLNVKSSLIDTKHLIIPLVILISLVGCLVHTESIKKKFKLNKRNLLKH